MLNPKFRWFKRLQITPKVFLITFFCLESLILTLGYSYHRYSSSILIESQMNYAQQMVEKSDRYLEMNLQHIQTYLLSIAHDNRFGNEEHEQIDQWMNDKLIYYIPNVSNIHLLSGRTILSSTSLHSWDLLEDSYLMHQLERLTEYNRIYWLGPYFSNVSTHTLTAAIKIPSSTDSPRILLFDVDLESLYRALLPNNTPSEIGKLILLDSELDAVYGSEPYTAYLHREHRFVLDGIPPGLLKKDWLQTESLDTSGKEIILTRGMNDITNWQMIWIMDKSDLLQPLNSTIRLSWWLAVASLLLSTVLSLLISNFITRPIRKIASSIKEVSAGNFNTEVHMDRQDEIGFLALHFNKMTKKIGDLIHELKETEELKKQSDFKALHTQIKPHFLYNTLNTISMLGRQGQAEHMDRLISALTSQLHYTLDASPAPVTLWEELKAVDNYVQLMKSRYPGKFNFDMDIDPLTLNKKVPKFILQPLVENCIFHGLVPKSVTGTLFISSVAEERYWELLIEDNGIGMRGETLEELSRRLQMPGDTKLTSEHIGLMNVHERLRLMFGSEYHMAIHSEEERGTFITIKLPFPDSTESGK
jgi:two-component system sensor histidine kinase YesM